MYDGPEPRLRPWVGEGAPPGGKPTASADPVFSKMRMPAARSVSDEPIVETSCALQR